MDASINFTAPAQASLRRRSTISPMAALRADTHRLCGSFSWRQAIRAAMVNRHFRPLLTLRMSQDTAAGGHRIRNTLWRLAHRLACRRAGIDLPWNSRLGAGLAINHGWALVVNAGARIGNNVTLFHGVTLGRKDSIGPEGRRVAGFPVIEDNVWIGPHAIVVGDVTIGRGSIVGAGAVVVRDVPPGSVVAGNPAEIVRTGCQPDVLNRAPLPGL